MDPGSKDNGGELGIVSRDDLVPEFAAAAFRLQNNEISPIVKTKFGYHIIQMMNRQGEKAKLRHILIKPLVTSDMVSLALKKADSVRADIISGKMSFSTAVGKYTYDDATKVSGGFFTNAQTGATYIAAEELEPGVALEITNMKTGEYSMPKEFTDQGGDRLVRIIYLRNRTEPHKANLKDDYAKIQQVALAEKQNKYLFNWITDKTPTFFIKIDEEFMTCPNLAKWASHKD
jgi:peptidyl-prolyl cis-trans isomerase SurA